ncbi:MAG: hypothetical protein ACI88H_001369 [Cocleimonas sp.]|jgi:hypothetical protein
MFVREQGTKGISYRFFTLSDGQEFSMSIDACSYPKECWNNYNDSVEDFINSLTDSLKMSFWLSYKGETSFVDWKGIVDNLEVAVNGGFDQQLIINFIDDFHLTLLTCD